MCTRLVYLGPEETVLTARSMDWKLDVGTNLWIFPRGMTRSGQVGPNSVEWTSRYGSVIASAYDICTTDGVNEAGLSANLLWLAESEYSQYDGTSPGMCISVWAQYVLDRYATVAEAIAELGAEPFAVVTGGVPGEDRLATLHMSLSDASGDSAIIEYIDGRQVIHHGREYQVMTNSPTFDEQLAVSAYWRQISGTVMLPGTNRAADRFVRASFYVDAVPQTADPDVALASVVSVIRNASVPFGISTPDAPNISSTRWRTVTDHKRLLYIFESALAPNAFWVNLKDLDFAEGAKVRRLVLGKDQRNAFARNVTDLFEAAEPFEFMGV